MRRSILPASPPMRLLTTALLSVALLAIVAPDAFANGPRWQLISSSMPTRLAPGADGKIVVLATNIGDTSVNATEAPIVLSDVLPAGLHATEVSGVAETQGHISELICSHAIPAKCTFAGPRPLTPYGDLEMRITVQVSTEASTGTDNEARVSGGRAIVGAEPASLNTKQPIEVSQTTAPFGIERFEFMPENEDGSADTQAGSHPFQESFVLGLNTRQENGLVKPAALPKDLTFRLPAGMVGNPSAVPQCSESDFFASSNRVNLCPADTAVGVVSTTVTEPTTIERGEPYTSPVPLFNLPPVHGEPARFGFLAIGIPVILDTSVRTGGDYGITVSSHNILQTAGVLSSRVTLWGVPGDAHHEASRGWECLNGETCGTSGGSEGRPFLTLPSSCDATGESVETTAEGDSWSAPGKPTEVAAPVTDRLLDSSGGPFGFGGCGSLPFTPAIAVATEGSAGSSSTGLSVSVHVPQDVSTNSSGIAESDVRDTTVTLPPGMQVNPAAAGGLQACSEAEIGFMGFNSRVGYAEFTSELPAPLEPGVNFCPAASKIATASIKTPLLPNELTGAVYLATPQHLGGAPLVNPFGTLIAMYLVAQDPVSGVLVKVPGKVQLDPQTGQLTASFENTPQVPFEELTLRFFGGPRATLSTPPFCGSYSTHASFAPWSGSAPVESVSAFSIDTGPRGTPCADPLPFSPSLTGGSVNIQAGAFTPVTVGMTREDGQQSFDTVRLNLPSGLLGRLSSVTPCPEPNAAQGLCGPESLIGHTTAKVGVGDESYSPPAGQVFLTGSYKGAPYGLSIAEPATAGPFDLGSGPCDCVVIRAKIDVDPHTAALTAESDPLPTILDGVPLQIKQVSVTIDRPGFTFNPTNCAAMNITGVLAGGQGALEPESVPFRVANCATLPFAPKFTALTKAKTSKARGAYLHVKVVSGPGQANIGKVKVDLPVQLPSRLATLHKACLAAVFDTDPAGCPAASAVGLAAVRTPVLKGILSGPAYLVSYGAARLPDLEMVLQGEGITLILDGNTVIKNGITSSIFRAVPDAPIDSFDLVLPTGPDSALAAYLPGKAKGSMCGQRLLMPTSITGQNGAVERQMTKVTVSGCPKARKARRKRRR